MTIADVKRWEPRTSYVKEDKFKFKNVIYRVLESFISGPAFDDNDDRYVAEGAPHITNIEITEDTKELVVTYEDGSNIRVGVVGGGGDSGPSYYGVIERLVATGSNTLSEPNSEIDTTQPVKLTINHTTYFSVEIPPPFTVTANAIAWNTSNAGFSLDDSDSIVVEYTKVH